MIGATTNVEHEVAAQLHEVTQSRQFTAEHDASEATNGHFHNESQSFGDVSTKRALWSPKLERRQYEELRL